MNETTMTGGDLGRPPTDWQEARAGARPPREGLIRGGGDLHLRGYSGPAPSERALTDAEALAFELAARSAFIDHMAETRSSSSGDWCRFHGEVHEDPSRWAASDDRWRVIEAAERGQTDDVSMPSYDAAGR